MLWNWVLLFVAAFFAGGLNAVAGGGSFLTLPALVLAGVPPVAANATGTLSLLPGYIASAWALRKEIKSLKGISIRLLVAASLLGGTIGASFFSGPQPRFSTHSSPGCCLQRRYFSF